MYGITVYFNPCNYANRYDNYQIFRQTTKSQHLKLLTVELTFGNNPNVLSAPKDAETVLHIKGKKNKNLMWQKERLLNIALDKLPDDCTKVCWLDCDVIFKNDDWVNLTSDKLDEVPIVQPYSIVSMLPKGWRDPGDSKNTLWLSPKDTKSSYAYFKVYQSLRYRSEKHYELLRTAFPQATELEIIKRFDNVYQTMDKTKPEKEMMELLDLNIEELITPGYAWAATREFLKSVGGLYDKCIVGGGDNIFRYGLEDSALPHQSSTLFSTKHLKDINKYLTLVNLKAQNKGIGCVGGIILHMYHGSVKNRQYRTRYYSLIQHKFNPKKHIKLNKKGVYEWNYKQPHVKLIAKKVKKYFKHRKEDD